VKNTDKYCVIVYFYVEDMLILCSNDYIIKSTKKILTKQVWYERLGNKYF
jgi:hypothetical protein